MYRGSKGHWHLENVDSGIDNESDDNEYKSDRKDNKMKGDKSLLQKGRKDHWRIKNLHSKS